MSKFNELKNFLLNKKLSITHQHLEKLIDLSPSQLGQDLLALYFNNFEKHKYFIDIGANDGMKLFDPYSDDYESYELEVYKPFNDFIESMGYYVESYDAGTFFILPG